MSSARNGHASASVKAEPAFDANVLSHKDSAGNMPPIRFTSGEIDRQLKGQALASAIRRRYSNSEWAGFNTNQRTVIYTKALELQNKNRSRATAAGALDLSQPNFSARTSKGVEVWPQAAENREFSTNEKDMFRAAMRLSTQDKAAQRGCADRFAKGKIKFPETRQSCFRCYDHHYRCERQDGILPCKACDTSEDGFRCEFLDRYYIDYASRELNIDLSTASALFAVVRAPGRACVAKGRAVKPGLKSVNRPQEEPSSASTVGPSKRPKNTNQSPDRRQSQSGNKRPSGGQKEPTRARSPSVTPTPSVIEVSPPTTPDAGGSASNGRPAKRQRLANDSDPTELVLLKAENQLLRKRFDALRTLSQAYYHQISDLHTVFQISTPNIISALKESAEIVRPLVEHGEELHAASLEFRKKLMAVDKEMKDDTSL